MAAKHLPKPLDEYPKYHTPSAKDLVEAYDEERDRVGTLGPDEQAAYASKCGAGIFAGPCSRFDALYTLGMCSTTTTTTKTNLVLLLLHVLEVPHLPDRTDDEGDREMHRVHGTDLRSWHRVRWRVSLDL